MTKGDLIEFLYEQMGLFTKKEIGEFVDTTFDIIKQALKSGEKIKISGFGNFEVKNKKERIGRNPKTNEEIKIPPRKVVTFKTSQVLKNELNKDKALIIQLKNA